MLDDTASIYVQDETPNAEKEYRVRYYMNPNSLIMGSSDTVTVFTGMTNTTDALRVQLKKNTTLRLDDDNSALAYTGTWATIAHDSAYGGDYQRSTALNSTMTYAFTGDKVQWEYIKATNGGVVDVYIDDVKVDSVNQYNASTTFGNLWTSATLPNTYHTLKLVHVSGTYGYLDAVDVFNNYQLRASLFNDTSAWTDTNWYDVPNTWFATELKYHAFSTSGSLTLWIDDTQKQTLSAIDNDTKTITQVRLGAQSVPSTTNGTLYFDDFESRRFSYIGAMPDPGVDDPQASNPVGWTTRTFQYNSTQPHAVDQVTPETGSPDT